MKAGDILEKKTAMLSGPVTDKTLSQAHVEFYTLAFSCCLESKYCPCELQRDLDTTICPRE